MKKEREFEIGIAKLSNKQHYYEFDLDDSFFELFGTEIMQGGKLTAKVELDKTETLLTFHFDIKGQVRLTCDRSLEEFDQPVDIQQVFRIRYGEEDAELDDDLWQIKSNTQSINMAQHLYDYLGLSLPMKKLHPRFVEESEEDEDNQEDILIYSSKDHDKGGDEDGDKGDDDDDIDPRWSALRNLN